MPLLLQCGNTLLIIQDVIVELDVLQLLRVLEWQLLLDVWDFRGDSEKGSNLFLEQLVLLLELGQRYVGKGADLVKATELVNDVFVTNTLLKAVQYSNHSALKFAVINVSKSLFLVDCFAKSIYVHEYAFQDFLHSWSEVLGFFSRSYFFRWFYLLNGVYLFL